MIRFVEVQGKHSPEITEKIEEFYASLFEQTDIEKFRERIAEAEDLLVNLAFDAEKIVGFKIGYQIDSTKFYSWIGGVDEDYRNQKIAHELMKRQHDWCIEKGYKIVQTKTKNSFKPMLILNIKNGFDIVDVYRKSNDELRIVLEKDLVKNL